MIKLPLIMQIQIIPSPITWQLAPILRPRTSAIFKIKFILLSHKPIFPPNIRPPTIPINISIITLNIKTQTKTKEIFPTTIKPSITITTEITITKRVMETMEEELMEEETETFIPINKIPIFNPITILIRLIIKVLNRVCHFLPTIKSINSPTRIIPIRTKISNSNLLRINKEIKASTRGILPITTIITIKIIILREATTITTIKNSTRITTTRGPINITTTSIPTIINITTTEDTTTTGDIITTTTISIITTSPTIGTTIDITITTIIIQENKIFLQAYKILKFCSHQGNKPMKSLINVKIAKSPSRPYLLTKSIWSPTSSAKRKVVTLVLVK